KTITPVRDADNEIVHFISNDRDVTDRKRLESQLQQVQRMDAIGAFAGGIAHDFNNLLMVISAYSELTLEALSPDHPQRSNGGELKIETSMVRLDEGYVHQHPSATPGDYVLLTITDSGEGIATEHMAHIFEPFYTTKARGKGTGLGLATIYNVVKHCGGFIWVYSEKGLGTTFKVYFPCVEQKANASLESDTPVRGTETILLVEDDAAVRKSERDFLTASGYSVLEAANAEGAMEIAKRNLGAV